MVDVLLIVFTILASSMLFAAGVRLAGYYHRLSDERVRKAVEDYRDTLTSYGVLQEVSRPDGQQSGDSGVRLYMHASPRVSGGTI